MLQVHGDDVNTGLFLSYWEKEVYYEKKSQEKNGPRGSPVKTEHDKGLKKNLKKGSGRREKQEKEF